MARTDRARMESETATNTEWASGQEMVRAWVTSREFTGLLPRLWLARFALTRCIRTKRAKQRCKDTSHCECWLERMVEPKRFRLCTGLVWVWMRTRLARCAVGNSSQQKTRRGGRWPVGLPSKRC